MPTGRALLRPGSDFVRCVVDFVFPPRCALCHRDMAAGFHGSDTFCPACRKELTAGAEQICRRCGAPIGPHLNPDLPCSGCRRERFAFDRVICLGQYAGRLRFACLQAKQPAQEQMTAGLARVAHHRRETEFADLTVDVVVPVPYFWLQRMFRWHNPAETLAQAWGRILLVPCRCHILAKVRWTKPQTALSARGRRENLRGAFRVKRRKSIDGATVLLVDDIMTTGSTAHEAARTLKQAGAASVVLAVVARSLQTTK